MTDQQTATYKTALKEARGAFDRASKRLREISAESESLSDEIGRLRRTITALAALCSEEPGLDDLGITESCVEVMAEQKRLVTTMDVVEALEMRGFDMESQNNPAASVHAVLTRLAMRGKIEKLKEGELVKWKGPNYVGPGPEITDEDIPF